MTDADAAGQERARSERASAIAIAARLRERQRWPFWAAVGVLVVGLAVSGVLTWVSEQQYMRNEKRLLALRARDVASAVTAALPTIQTPLASAAALADATRGNRTKFKHFIAPYVGRGNQQPFASVSLWRLGNTGRGPLAVVGLRPALNPSSRRTTAFLVRAGASSTLSVIGMLQRPSPRLGFAFSGMSNGPFVVYGESVLPPSRYAPPQANSQFSDLSFAVYLGASRARRQLLTATVRRFPLGGRTTTARVPFGDSLITVTVAPRGSLGGSLPQRLPWVIAVVGALLTLGAAGLAIRLIERRRATEGLARRLEEVAEENRRLYAEQRGIAQTLQHALLPESLPRLPGLDVSARYEAGAEGVEIGGDWYDLIPTGDGRLLLVVGDVSGRGLPAATAMAALRFAIHAYAAQGDNPVTFLPKLSALVNVSHDSLLATVLCAAVDVRQRTVSVTSAGHLPPLLISAVGSEFIDSPVGLPVGVDRDASYSASTISAPAGATLLAFTDGLVERRGESIDVGLERLRAKVSGDSLPLDELLTLILNDLGHDASDDTAIAGIRWMS